MKTHRRRTQIAESEVSVKKHKRAEKQIQQQNEYLNTILESLPHPFYVIDANDYTILKSNSATGLRQASETITCYKLTHRKDKPCSDRKHPCPVNQVKKTKKLITVEHLHYDTEGNPKFVEITAYPIIDNKGNVTQVIECALDITERKQAEEALRRSERELAIRNQIANIFLTVPVEEMYGKVLEIILEVMQSRYGVFGYLDENGDLIVPSMTRHIWDQCQVPDKDIVFPRMQWGGSTWPRAIKEKRIIYSNNPSCNVPEGHIAIIRHISLPILYQGEVIGLFQVANKEVDYDEKDIQSLATLAEHIAPILNARLQRDFQERARKQAEDFLHLQRNLAVALSAAHELDEGVRLCVEAAIHSSGMDCGGVSLVDETSGALDLVYHRGLSPDFIKGVSHYDADSANARLVMAGKPIYTEFQNLGVPLDEAVRQEGLLAIAIIPIHHEDKVIGCLNIASHTVQEVPISARKALETIAAQIGSAIARLKSEEAFRKSKARFKGLVDLLPQTVFEVDAEANFLFVNAFGLKSFGYTQEDIDKGLNAFQLVILKDREKAENDFRKVLNGEKSIGNEYTVLRKDGSTFPAILYASPIIFDDRPVGMRGIAVDITERKQLIEERLKNLERLRRSLEETIGALSSTIEARDPFTAGHQKRVADLAVAVAEEMGLSSEQIDGIRMASLVHDVGKVYIPSDLLNKSKRLNGPEYELFKNHCQVGYDILKTIDFPWPVASMVLQHHERQDGSGYPQGLYGEDIMLEARILAVADVVEAMSGHRPYRPAYSVGDALEEVLHYKDSLYDSEVVDACLRVFYNKGFAFQEVEMTEM